MTMTDDWTREWPQTIGWFWFYGSDHHMRKGFRRLYAVSVEREVAKDGESGLVYRYLGGQLLLSNGPTGVWLKMQVPEIPGARS